MRVNLLKSIEVGVVSKAWTTILSTGKWNLIAKSQSPSLEKYKVSGLGFRAEIKILKYLSGTGVESE